MTEYRQEDGAGQSILYLNTDGYTTNSFGTPEETSRRIREMKNFKCRPDDIFICAPVKSGTHWTWEIISMMFQGKAETIKCRKIQNMLEAFPWREMEKMTSPRILNTHVNYNRLPNEVKGLGCKLIYVLRNPKDLAVSLYNHTIGLPEFEYKGRWENFLPLFLQGKTEYNSWFEYVLEWEKVMSDNPNLPIHLIYYEDLKENTLHEVYRLGNFLGIENKDGLFEAICEKCQFENMAREKQQYLTPFDVELHGFTFYRKGEVGDWKNWFTVTQNEHFENFYNEMMKISKHKFKYELKQTR